MRILSPNGRLNRLQYFLQSLFTILVLHVAVAVYFIWTVARMHASGGKAYDEVLLSGGQVAALASLFLLSLLCAWILVVSQIKRLHDLNQSGWLVLINLIPGAGLVMWIVLIFARGADQPSGHRFSPA